MFSALCKMFVHHKEQPSGQRRSLSKTNGCRTLASGGNTRQQIFYVGMEGKERTNPHITDAIW